MNKACVPEADEGGGGREDIHLPCWAHTSSIPCSVNQSQARNRSKSILCLVQRGEGRGQRKPRSHPSAGFWKLCGISHPGAPTGDRLPTTWSQARPQPAPAGPSQCCTVSIWGPHETKLFLKRDENRIGNILSIKGVITRHPLSPTIISFKKDDFSSEKKKT